MSSNLEVARSVRLRPIADVAAELGVDPALVEPYGHHKAKLDLAAAHKQPRGRLILITAMTATSAGEGKTTTTIGLAQALRRLGKRSVVALRQPSLGPVFGSKGGGCGGGLSQVLPMEDINLHFTGDLHAVTAAHNLLATLVDNQLHFHGASDLDPRRVIWHRAMDMNDRALRHVTVGLGGTGVSREDSFAITAASEIMAILSLARDLPDLKQRLGRILVGYSHADAPVFARDVGAQGALAVLLKDALKPNLVQTFEGGPALVHGGPFANIGHGCSSLLATYTAMGHADYVVTEAGFASDLGAEKFFDIKCRIGGIWPRAVVVVATCRALKMHGLGNLDKHIENIACFGLQAVVALNRFDGDSEQDIASVAQHCRGRGLRFACSDAFARGGAGAEELGREVLAAVDEVPTQVGPLYPLSMSPEDKIITIARRMYGARGATFDARAQADLDRVRRLGLEALPVCIAKTQKSLSDDPALPGRPTNFDVTVRQVRIAAGAGFLVAIAGNILTMPGLPREPAALNFDLDDDGLVRGLF